MRTGVGRPRDRALHAEADGVGRQLVLADDPVHRLERVDVELLRRVERLDGRDLVDGHGGGHDQRVAVVGAEVRHPAVGDARHDLAASAERGERQAAADALGEAHEVGRDAEPLRGAGVPGGETGLHLVEDQQRAVGVAHGAHAREVALVRDDDADVLEHRLHEHARDLVAVLGEELLEPGEVVVGDDVDGARLDLERRDRGRARPRGRPRRRRA